MKHVGGEDLIKNATSQGMFWAERGLNGMENQKISFPDFSHPYQAFG